MTTALVWGGQTSFASMPSDRLLTVNGTQKRADQVVAGDVVYLPEFSAFVTIDVVVHPVTGLITLPIGG